MAKKVRYDLSLSVDEDERNNEMRYFFGVSRSVLLAKAMKLMYVYMVFKKKNPKGRIALISEEEVTPLIIFNEDY